MCVCSCVCACVCVCVHPLHSLCAVEEAVSDQLQGVKEKERVNEVNLTNLAPRKPDWSVLGEGCNLIGQLHEVRLTGHLKGIGDCTA